MLLFVTNAAVAQQSTQGFGASPYPSWHKHDGKIYSTYDQEKSGKRTIQQWLPKGQNDSNWTKRYWITDAPNAPASPQKVLNRQLKRFAEDCAGQAKFHDEKLRRGAVKAYVLCERHKTTGMGHFRVQWVGERNGTMVFVQEEWRGKAFEIGQETRRFVNNNDVQSIVQSIRKTSLY